MRSYEYLTVKKRKTLFVSTIDSLIWLEDLHRVGGDVGEFGRERRGGFSFRDADVVTFTFDLDFPEGLSCRESIVDESGGKTVPYRPWK